MRFSLTSSTICAIVTTVFPFARVYGTLPEGIYQFASLAFESPIRVLDLADSDPAPNTPIIIFQDNGGQNQRWNVTASGSGYTLTAVSPGSHAFVHSVEPASPLFGMPNNATTFQFNQVGEDMYQILAASNDGAFAVQIPSGDNDVNDVIVSLERLNATNPAQIWRLTRHE